MYYLFITVIIITWFSFRRSRGRPTGWCRCQTTEPRPRLRRWHRDVAGRAWTSFSPELWRRCAVRELLCHRGRVWGELRGGRRTDRHCVWHDLQVWTWGQYGVDNDRGCFRHSKVPVLCCWRWQGKVLQASVISVWSKWCLIQINCEWIMSCNVFVIFS